VLYSYGVPQDNAAQTGSGSADIAQTAVTIPGPTFSSTFGSYSVSVLALGGSLPATPAAPSNLSATAVSKSQINLAWTDNANNETGFEVDRASNSSFTSGLVTADVGANVTSYKATGLAGGKTYYFRVRAFNSSGNSSFSNTANATTFRH
jgi:predicted phage tail protein